RVGGEPLVEDDLAALVVAPSLGPALQRELPDRVAELRREVLERGEEVRVAVAGDRLRRGREWDRLHAWQDLGLGDVEHGDRAEERALLAGLVGAGVTVLDGDRREDVNRLGALRDDAVESEPRAEPGDVRGGDPAPV